MAAGNEAYITGIGQSQIGIRLTRHPLLLTLDAVREALGEAGLTIGQIDGVSTYPGRTPGYLGFSPVGADELVDAVCGGNAGSVVLGVTPASDALALANTESGLSIDMIASAMPAAAVAAVPPFRIRDHHSARLMLLSPPLPNRCLGSSPS